MPHRSGDDPRNVVLNVMNAPFEAYALTEEELARWDRLIALRGDVNLVLESARAAKRIGKPLEAAVTLRAGSESARESLRAVEGMNLAELFIVSQCLIAEDGADEADAVTGEGVNVSGLSVAVKEAPGLKCPRCAAVVAGMEE